MDSPGPRSRRAGLAALSAALVTVLALHLVSPGVDPVRDMLSDYAWSPHGHLFAAAILLVVAGSLLLPPWRRTTTATAFFTTWCVTLLIVALCRRDMPGAPPTVTGHIHLTAAAIALFALPLGVLTAAPARRTLAAVCLLLAFAVVAAFLLGPPVRDAIGLLERLLAAAEIALVADAGQPHPHAPVPPAADQLPQPALSPTADAPATPRPDSTQAEQQPRTTNA